MDTKPPKRRLRSLLGLVIHTKSTKNQSHKSSSQQPQDLNHTPKKDGRLRRLGQGIRRWRHGRKKDGGAQEGYSYRHSKTSTAFTSSSQRSLSIHCQGNLKHEPEVTDVRSENPEKEDGKMIFDEIILENVDTQQQAIVPSLKFDLPAVDDTTSRSSDSNENKISFPVETGLAVVEKAPSSADNELVSDTETAFDAPAHFSIPQPVHIRKRQEAKQFANSMVSSVSSKKYSDKLIFWTDASMRKTKHNGIRGGTSVAQQQDGRWKVEYAHVVGMKSTALLEALAILTALNIALHNCCGTEFIFVLSDSKACLTWLAKLLSLFPAMEEANRELQASKCYARAVVSFSQAFGFSKLDKYPGNDLQAVLCLQILEAYSKLRQLGVMVEFHWVPGHSQVIGNIIADLWAFNACLWFADVSMCVNDKEARVIPLQPLEFTEPWSDNCRRLSKQRPAVASLSQILEDVKHLQYVLRVESNQVPRTGAVPKQLAPGSTIQELPKNSKVKGAKEPRKCRVECRACKKRGHVREQCKFSTPCALCQRRGHSEENCYTRRLCAFCGETGHLRKRCQKKKKAMALPDAVGVTSEQPTPSASMTIPEASLFVSLLHPTLTSKSLHGASSRYMLGRVGLNPHLAPNVDFEVRPSVGLSLGSGI